VPAGLDGAHDRVSSSVRRELLQRVADAVLDLPQHPNVLVGIDGASGTGKSTFADELAEVIGAAGRSAVRATIDSFHRPRNERYRRGADSPDGYYLDSHDLNALPRRLLTPFSTGAGFYVTATFDEPSDSPVDKPATVVPSSTVLVFDGLFLHRPELVAFWDLTVFLIADRRRAAAWDEYLHRDLPDDPAQRAAQIEARTSRARRPRYVEGQAIYERLADPRSNAHLVIDNDDLACPLAVRS
jgi:uridine kinase